MATPLALLLVACRVDPVPGGSNEPSGVASVDADELAVACVLAPEDTVTVFQRPSPTAGVFGEAAPGDTLRPVASAAGGWLGFDPAVAQAANVGPFRLRWVAPDGPFTLSGGCLALPVVDAPAEGCYAMAGSPIALRAGPATDAAVVDSLPAGGFVPVVGRSGDWARVRMIDGREAWVAPGDGNFNGPCG
jgi:hypothetical protein